MQASFSHRKALFLSHVSPEPFSGCWLWHGYVCHCGYGRWWRGKGHSALAHRGAYELFRGPILPGLELDHACRTRFCVNPWHLRPVSRAAHALLTAQFRPKPAKLPLRRSVPNRNTLSCLRTALSR